MCILQQLIKDTNIIFENNKCHCDITFGNEHMQLIFNKITSSKIKDDMILDELTHYSLVYKKGVIEYEYEYGVTNNKLKDIELIATVFDKNITGLIFDNTIVLNCYAFYNNYMIKQMQIRLKNNVKIVKGTLNDYLTNEIYSVSYCDKNLYKVGSQIDNVDEYNGTFENIDDVFIEIKKHLSDDTECDHIVQMGIDMEVGKNLKNLFKYVDETNVYDISNIFKNERNFLMSTQL